MPRGRVIVNFRRHSIVEDAAGERHECLLKGRRLKPVCGDWVDWQQLPDGTNIIEAIEPRRSVLQRYEGRKGAQVLAANVDRLLIVTAPVPMLDTFLLDKYLVAADALGITPVILFNKVDQVPAESWPLFEETLDEYRDIGIEVRILSALEQRGVPELQTALENHTGVLVGASGTGKSSIAAALLPHAGIETGMVSHASGEGRHTTTRTTLFHLPGSGELIDSPGVRDFILWPMPVRELREHFVEFREPARHCRFADCTHLNEPGCAVQDALEEGEILLRRYDSYRGLAKIMQNQYVEHQARR